MEFVEFGLREGPNGVKERSVLEVLKELSESKRIAGQSLAYQRKLRWTLGNFVQRFRNDPISAIDSKSIETWLGTNRWGITTRRNALADVSVLFSFAVKRGYARTNPTQGVIRPYLPDTAPQILTPEQVRSILFRALEKDRGPLRFFALRLFGGLRASEAAKLSPDRIKDDYIEVYSQKTHRRRLVEKNGTLRAWLDLGGDWPLKNLKHRVEKLFEPGEIPQNAMRHSFCSYAFAMYGPGRSAAESGHSEAILARHYRELVPKSVAENYRSIFPPAEQTSARQRGDQTTARFWEFD